MHGSKLIFRTCVDLPSNILHPAQIIFLFMWNASLNVFLLPFTTESESSEAKFLSFL